MKAWQGLLLVLLASIACLLPVLGRGHVFFAHGNEIEVGRPLDPQATGLANRRLSDQSAAFAPELALHLADTHASWTALWNPHVQLGRPAQHTGGMSKAFWLTHVASWFSADALWALTLVVCAMLLLSAAFAYGLALELGARVWVAAACGLALAFSPFTAYWSSFPIFIAGLCWTLGVLCFSARCLRAGGGWNAWALCLSVHSLLLSAYPQACVWSAYLVLPMCVLWCQRHGRQHLGAWLLAGACGALSTLPVLADLWLQAQRSARLEVDPSFFTAVLPRPSSWAEWIEALAALVDSSLRGNPLANPRPASFVWSAALTPLLAVLCLRALGRRMAAEAWILGLYCLWLLLASFVPAVYLLGWEYLGFSLSRFVPLGAWLIPAWMLAILGAERMLRGGIPYLAIAWVLLLLGLDSAWNGATLEGWIGAGASLGLTAISAWRRDPRWLFAAAAAGALGYGSMQFLSRPAHSVARDSELVQRVRELCPDSARFAWLGSAPSRILPPNQECWLGLHSVHSYDSLSSRAYQAWCASISQEAARNYGRKFDHIEGLSGLRTPQFARARVAVLLSEEGPAPAGYQRVAQHARVQLWRAPSVQDAAQFSSTPTPIVWNSSADERMQLSFEPLPQTDWLVLSQQYHPHWEARSAGQLLPTKAYEDLWQAVQVPAGASEIELEFRPWVRWAWLPQALLALSALLLLLRLLRQPRSPSVVETQR